MKKIILSLIAVVALFGIAKADELTVGDVLKKFPSVNNGILFSVNSKDVQYVSSVTLAQFFNDKLKIDAGWTPSQEGVVLVSWQTFKAQDITKIPVLEYIVIEPFVYAGFDRISLGAGNAKDGNEFDYGAGAKILNIRF
jgi:hypothetical protein